MTGAAAALLSSLMRQDGPTVTFQALTPLPQTVLIDADRLQQVVNNLMMDALKFSRHGEIFLTLAAESHLILTVSDSGSGIPLDEQQKLFDPWYQAPSGQSVSVQGSGLGLFICREIVSRMGGEIRINSRPDVGTRVIVTLPLMLCDTPEISDENVLPLYPHLRVAVVDDHPANLLVMQQQLARFAIQADGYEQGRALLRADAQQPYDLLFIDQMMPRPNGMQLLRLLRRRDRQRNRQPLRILCSANSQRLSVTLQENEQMLTKPVLLRDIAALLQRL